MKAKRSLVVVLMSALALTGLMPVAATAAGPNLVEVAVGINSDTNSPYYQQFDVLIAAVLAADPVVVQTLTKPGQRTVFAPVDAAFEALGITTNNVDTLDQAWLTEVLTYHVINGRRKANSVTRARQLRTLQGGFLQQSGGVLTDGLGRSATIIVTDVEAMNGIIHAIDNVVLPFEAPTLVDLALALNSDTNSPYYGEFDILIGAVLAADPSIVATLSARGQRTVFAPVDAAFEALGITTDNVGDLDQEYLTEVLAYHVTPGRRMAAQVLRMKNIRTLQGGFLMQSEGVLMDGLGRSSTIIVTDLLAKNGVIHAVDTVVLPYEAPTLVDLAIELNSNTNSPYYGQFDILIAGVLAADPSIVATLSAGGQRTVFAPVDAAFEALGITADNIGDIDQAELTEVLANHVTNGRLLSPQVLRRKNIRTLQGGFLMQSEGVLTDGLDREANIIVTDLKARNGIIHAIDNVVIPYEAPTIVDLAVELNSNSNSPYFGQFDTLIAAVLASDPVVVETLTGRGNHTVFAPTDAAFEAIGITTTNIGDIAVEDLTEVLAYHVVRGRLMSPQVLRAKQLRTLEGGFLMQAEGVLTDDLGRESNIIVTDLKAKNGIIHAVDQVVLPLDTPTVVDLAIELNTNGNSPYAGQFDILIAAVLAADPAIVEALTAPGQRTVFAPTDAAFENAGITEANIGDVDQAVLTEILAYHVTRGRLTARQVLNRRNIRTLQGGILKQNGGVLTDEAEGTSNIIVTDLKADNGIIHAIDAVVFPDTSE